MKRLRLTHDVKPVSALGSNAEACVAQVHREKRPLALTSEGEVTAVLMDVEEYERLHEELELLREIRQAERELEQGLGIPHEEARRQILEYVRRKA